MIIEFVSKDIKKSGWGKRILLFSIAFHKLSYFKITCRAHLQLLHEVLVIYIIPFDQLNRNFLTKISWISFITCRLHQKLKIEMMTENNLHKF